MKRSIKFIEQYSQFFQKHNWDTYNLINIEYDCDWMWWTTMNIRIIIIWIWIDIVWIKKIVFEGKKLQNKLQNITNI